MIRVRLWRDPDQVPVRVTVSGHAGRGQVGEDIVCAAASALVETLAIGLNTVLQEPYEGHIEPGDASVVFRQPMSASARAVVDTIMAGLEDLSRTEPDAVQYQERTR